MAPLGGWKVPLCSALGENIITLPSQQTIINSPFSLVHIKEKEIMNAGQDSFSKHIFFFKVVMEWCGKRKIMNCDLIFQKEKLGMSVSLFGGIKSFSAAYHKADTV